jgi:hypothetical protein
MMRHTIMPSRYEKEMIAPQRKRRHMQEAASSALRDQFILLTISRS